MVGHHIPDMFSCRLLTNKIRGFGQGGRALNTRKEKIEWHREGAADCEECAETSPNERAKTMLKDMAATSERLASRMEKGDLA